MDKQLLAKLLKHSADTGAGGGSAEAEVDSESVGQAEQGDTILPKTQSELDSMINKAVQTALKNKDAQHAQAMEAAVQAALKKEQDYSQLSEKERKEREFEDERAKLDEAKAKFAKEQLVVQLKGDLLDKGLPVSMAETFSLYADAEQALAAVTVFEKEFKAAVAEGIKVGLRQVTPGTGAGSGMAINYGQQLAKNATASSGKIVD